MAVKYECTICEGKISVGHDICGKCAKQLYELYGEGWQQLDWVKALTQNKHYMEKLEREETKAWRIGESYTANHHYIQETDAYSDITGRHVTDMGTSNHYTVQTTHLKSHKYDKDIAKYVRQGLGCRRIHRKLIENYGDTDIPTMRTINTRVQQFRGK